MLKVKSDIVYTKQANGNIVAISLSDPDNSFYTISGLATDFFEAIYNQKSLEELKKNTLEKYDVTENILNSDVEKLINDLKLNNILE